MQDMMKDPSKKEKLEKASAAFKSQLWFSYFYDPFNKILVNLYKTRSNASLLKIIWHSMK